MNNHRFWDLCETLANLESRLYIFNQPEHGDKAALKRVRKTLRDVLGLRDLDRLTREAKHLNMAWYVEQRTPFETDEDENAAKEKRKQAQTAYRHYCDDLYKVKFPSPDQDPERLERIRALREQIDYLKSEYEAEKQREEQIQADLNQSKARVSALKTSITLCLGTLEDIRITE